jgi:CBS domain-containing protein
MHEPTGGACGTASHLRDEGDAGSLAADARDRRRCLDRRDAIPRQHEFVAGDPKERNMNVDQCMSRNPQSCHAEDSLERAAQIMWEADCGCVPVLGEDSRVIGMITDRDICMAAYTRGARLRDVAVGSTMAHDPASCRPGDSIESALSTMRKRQVRRLPVLDAAGGLLGLISFMDIARGAVSQARVKSGRLSHEEILSAFSWIGRPHGAFEPDDGRDSGTEPDALLRQDRGVLEPRARSGRPSPVERPR